MWSYAIKKTQCYLWYSHQIHFKKNNFPFPLPDLPWKKQLGHQILTCTQNPHEGRSQGTPSSLKYGLSAQATVPRLITINKAIQNIRSLTTGCFIMLVLCCHQFLFGEILFKSETMWWQGQTKWWVSTHNGVTRLCCQLPNAILLSLPWSKSAWRTAFSIKGNLKWLPQIHHTLVHRNKILPTSFLQHPNGTKIMLPITVKSLAPLAIPTKTLEFQPPCQPSACRWPNETNRVQ